MATPLIADDELAAEVAADLEAQRLRADESWLADNSDRIGVPFTWAKDFPPVSAREMVVEGLVELGTLVEIFGEANTGKSTLAQDIALHIASGRPWRGRETLRGVVLWVALESAAGARRRVRAHCLRHDIDASELLFADITVDVRLLDVADVERVCTTAQTAALVAKTPCRLIVVDTLARAMAGGDENAAQDMGLLVKGCDMIRRDTGAAVLLVHHSGKDATRGARGSGALRAALDTEIEVTGQANPRQARVSKQRDLPSGDSFAFDLEPIEIGEDAKGRPITACVVTHRDEALGTPRRAPVGRNQQALLGAVREWCRARGSNVVPSSDLREIAKAQGITHRGRFGEVRECLERDGWLVPTVGGHRLQGHDL